MRTRGSQKLLASIIYSHVLGFLPTRLTKCQCSLEKRNMQEVRTPSRQSLETCEKVYLVMEGEREGSWNWSHFAQCMKDPKAQRNPSGGVHLGDLILK